MFVWKIKLFYIVSEFFGWWEKQLASILYAFLSSDKIGQKQKELRPWLSNPGGAWGGDNSQTPISKGRGKEISLRDVNQGMFCRRINATTFSHQSIFQDLLKELLVVLKKRWSHAEIGLFKIPTSISDLFIRA